MRKLVTVRQINAIDPIANADAIDCATVDGWKVVVKKGEFQVADLCVYFEIDSFLPLSDERYAFLAKNKTLLNEQEGIRLRTVKLRGQISQGLVFPLTVFPEIAAHVAGLDAHAIREIDFTDVLGIQKWEPPTSGAEIEGPFPSFIDKTDQERIQNLPHLLTEHAHELFEVTVKLDGSSMTIFHNRGETGVCSRNCLLKDLSNSPFWQAARSNRLLEALVATGRNLALQGELIGEGIQGNPEKLTGKHFYLFDIYDIQTGQRLGREARSQFVTELRTHGATLTEVPFLEETTLEKFEGDINKVLAYAEGASLNKDVLREGVVFKRLDGALSFKAISNSYLLKHGDR